MRPGSAIAATASRLRVFSLRELVVHRRRTTASIAVMAVSAMYLVAVFGIFGSITGSVNRLADGIAGIAALEVSGITDAGFPDTITADVAAVPGVATAAPMIRTSASTASGPVLLFGADKNSAALGGALKDAVAKPIKTLSANPNGVQVGPGVGHGKGETFRLGSASVAVTEVLTGKQLADLNGGHYVLAPLALAQNITGRKGQLDSILITTKPGANLAAVRAAVTDRREGPGNRCRSEHAGNPGRRRRQADELHGVDGCGSRVGGRRVPDLHHDDDGDHPAPAGHLDAARDRRPTRHHRSRPARRGRDSRGDRRSDRVGHRNRPGPHGDWSIASGDNPRSRGPGRVLAARLRDTGGAGGDGAHQRGSVGDGCAAGVQGFTDRGLGAGWGFSRGLRAAMAADGMRDCSRRAVRGVDRDRRRPTRHTRIRRDLRFVQC